MVLHQLRDTSLPSRPDPATNPLYIVAYPGYTQPGMSLAQRYPNNGAANSQHFPSFSGPFTSPWRHLDAPTSRRVRRCARRGAETRRKATAKLTAAYPNPKACYSCQREPVLYAVVKDSESPNTEPFATTKATPQGIRKE